MKDIVEGLNRYIEGKRKELNLEVSGHFVLQRAIIPNTTFKVYKTYKTILWYIQGGKKYSILEVCITDKVTEGQEERINSKMNIQICSELFEFFNANIDNIIKGNYAPDRI